MSATHTISAEPNREAQNAQLKRYYVTLTWDDWPDGGSYGSIVKASGPDEAEAMVKWEMAESRAADCDDSDASDMLETYGDDWDCVDCFDLDEFVSRHAKPSWPVVGNYDESSPVSCQCCDWTGRLGELGEIDRLYERVAPGEIMPAGECPECGALAHLDTTALDYPPEWNQPEASANEVDSARRTLSGETFRVDTHTHVLREDDGFWVHAWAWISGPPKASTDDH